MLHGMIASGSARSLPSHEGSGLKCCCTVFSSSLRLSPFSRREWIEIILVDKDDDQTMVSLLTKGVD